MKPGREGPCGLHRRDCGILAEKIRGHPGGNGWQGLILERPADSRRGKLLEGKFRRRKGGQESLRCSAEAM